MEEFPALSGHILFNADWYARVTNLACFVVVNKQEGNVLINLRWHWFTYSLATLHMFIGSHVHRQCFTFSLARIFNNVSFFENSIGVT